MGLSLFYSAIVIERLVCVLLRHPFLTMEDNDLLPLLPLKFSTQNPASRSGFILSTFSAARGIVLIYSSSLISFYIYCSILKHITLVFLQKKIALSFLCHMYYTSHHSFKTVRPLLLVRISPITMEKL